MSQKKGYESGLSRIEQQWMRDYDGKIVDQRFSKKGFEAYRAGEQLPRDVVIDFDLVVKVLSEELRRKQDIYRAL